MQVGCANQKSSAQVGCGTVGPTSMQEAKANARGRKGPATAEKVSSVSRVTCYEYRF